MTGFLHMGGFAAYVWIAYGAVALVLATNVIVPKRQHKKLIRELKQV